MKKFKQWYFSVEEEDTFPSETMVGKTYDQYPTTKEELEEIDEVSFYVVYCDVDEIEELPNFLPSLPHLKSVSLPINWLERVVIPTYIQELRISSDIFSEDKKWKWPKNLSFKNLKHLSIPEFIQAYEIDLSNFPKLESIEYDFSTEKNNSKVLEISKLSKLEKVTINQAKNLDVFTPFENSKLKEFKMFACTGKKLPIQNITKLKDLEYLRINNISVELDCNLFLELKNLEKLEILNIKNVTNIDVLLNHSNLKSLYVVDCKNSFAKTNKELFYNHGFKHLDIDYA